MSDDICNAIDWVGCTTTGPHHAHEIRMKAHKALASLRAENEKLRASMTAFMDAYYKQMRLQGWSDLDVFYNDDYRAAAAALKETGDE